MENKYNEWGVGEKMNDNNSILNVLRMLSAIVALIVVVILIVLSGIELEIFTWVFAIVFSSLILSKFFSR